ACPTLALVLDERPKVRALQDTAGPSLRPAGQQAHHPPEGPERPSQALSDARPGAPVRRRATLPRLPSARRQAPTLRGAAMTVKRVLWYVETNCERCGAEVEQQPMHPPDEDPVVVVLDATAFGCETCGGALEVTHCFPLGREVRA